MLFADKEPSAEALALGYEKQEPFGAKCETYSWIGQDFSFCDRCSAPCWEHPYKPGMAEHAGLRKPLDLKAAHAMWQKWGRPRGIPFFTQSQVHLMDLDEITPMETHKENTRMNNLHPSVKHVLAFFAFDHLPTELALVSEPFSHLAYDIAHRAPANPETTVALRKLLESKDAAVRAAL